MASGKLTNKTTLSGTISSGNSLKTATITTGSGTTDHSRLVNRAEPDQHPIEAITNLRSELDSKLNSETAMPLIQDALQGKAKGLYFDAIKEFARKSYWYLTAEIDPKTGLGTKESIISGPYDLGMGGGSGGGGGVTSVSIKQLNWPTTVVLGKPVSLSINWSSTIGEEKEPTGNGSVYLSINGKQVAIKSNQPQGIVTFENLDLALGTNTIEIKVIDAYGTAKPTVGTLTAVELLITDEDVFNDGIAWTGDIAYKYKVFGNFKKQVYFKIDGEVYATQEITTSGDLKELQIRGLSHGMHTLEVYFTATLNGESVTSNSLYHELIVYDKGNSTPIIASNFAKDSVQEQYLTFSIPYYVYVDGLTQPRVYYYLEQQGIRTELSIFAGGVLVDRSLQKLPYSFDKYYADDPTLNTYNIIIKCGETEKKFNIEVIESKINVAPVTTALTLHLDAQGRSNSEPNRASWIDKASGVSCEMTGFNWASNGWMNDITTGESFLRLNAGAKVVVPHRVLSGTPQNGGKTIELDFAARDIRDYETPILTCRNAAVRKFYNTSTNFVDSDIRAKNFTVTLDSERFSQAFPSAGTYIFEYLTEDAWKLSGGDTIDLATCGITLTEHLENADGEYPDSWKIAGDLIVITVTEDAIGFYVTPQKAAIRSLQSQLSVQFKEEEHVRISIVIEDASTTSPTHILWIYVNGIASCAIQYPLQGENFAHENFMYLGADNGIATLDIYNIRVYSQALTSKQIVENWIADTQNPTLKASRYFKNNIYDSWSGKITPESIEALGNLPYIIWDIDNLPQFKGDKRLGNVVYKDLLGKDRSFKSGDATYNVQGTSSAGYPVKNIRIKYKQAKAEEFPNCDFWWENGYEGEEGEAIKKFPITVDGIGDNYFTYKVDYASSEGANNVELTKLYNDLSKELGILTPPQRQNSKVRVGIDGFPIVAFHEDATGTRTFCTKANFNNDKDNEDVYGFAEGDESWEITNNSFRTTKFKAGVNITDKDSSDYYTRAFEARFPEDNENLNNLKAMTDWVASTDPEQATDKSLFELLGVESVTFNYIDKELGEDNSYKDVEKEETFDIDSREYRITKFKAELKSWFNVESTLLYYLFTEVFLMIDSRAKNAFPTYFAERQPGDGGNHWFWIPYDMDTALGINNMGELVFDYSLEDHGEFGKYAGGKVYNGQESVMWNNIREGFYGQLAAMYARMRGSLLNFTEIDQRFEDHQNKWPEAIFNEDAIIKYVNPLKSIAEGGMGENYLSMLQGSKAQQRKWWLFNRLRYIDSKYNAADAKADYIQFRAYAGGAGTAKPSITVIPYTDIYAAVSYSNGELKTARAPRNIATTIPTSFTSEDDSNEQETYIYSAGQLKDIGDLSPFYAKTVHAAAGTKLQRLIIGNADPSYKNENLRELQLGANTLLKVLDVRNCVNLGKNDTQGATPDIKIPGCTNIEEIYFTGTQITGIELPDGGTIKKLLLPGTMQALVIRNQPSIEVLQIDQVFDSKNQPYLELENLWLENIPFDKVNAKELLTLMLNKPTENIGASYSEDFGKYQRGVYLKGIDEYFTSLAELKTFKALLDNFFGLSIINKLIVPDLSSKAIVSGNVTISDRVEYSELANLCEWDEIEQAWRVKEYRDLLVKAPNTYCKVTVDSANTTIPIVQSIKQGTTITLPAAPTKESSVELDFKFVQWTASNGEIFEEKAVVKIDTDLTFIADYSDAPRQYTITFNTNSTVVSVLTPTVTVDYGSLINSPSFSLSLEDLNKLGIRCDGWYYPNGTEWNFNSSQVVMDLTLTAKWVDNSKPTITLTPQTYNTFNYEVEDNLGVIGWAVVKNSELPPDTWTTIEPKTTFMGTYEINGPGDYYFWILDAGTDEAGKNLIANAKIVAHKFDVIKNEGILGYTFEENLISIGKSFALNNIKLQLKVFIDSHYENLKINNELSSTNTLDFVATESCQFELLCDRKKYNIDFDLQQKGTQVESQSVTYLYPIEKPLSQYWRETNEIIIGWGLDPNGSQLWDFENFTVDRNVTLYAIWDVLNMPTILTIEIPEDTPKSPSGLYEITLNYQNTSGGLSTTETELVKIKFEPTEEDLHNLTLDPNDSSFTSSTLNKQVYGYATPGIKKILIYGNNKGYILGKAVDIPLVTPAKYLTTVELAWDIQKIAEGAFRGSSLTEVPLTDYITTIESYAFHGCNKLTQFKATSSLVDIQSQAFGSCEMLAELDFSDSAVTDLGDSAFASCISLTELDLPVSIQKLGASCFSNCQNLEKVILRNEELTMGGYVFNICPQLRSAGPLGSDADIEYAWKEEIPDFAFLMGTNQTNLSEISLPKGLKRIGASAFRNTKITKLVHSGYQDISETTLILPESVKIIGSEAFAHCRSLTTIIIPPTITSIFPRAFSNCPILSTVELYLTESKQQATDSSQGWFYLSGTVGQLVLKVLPEILDADNGILPEQYFGDYWNEYRVDTASGESDFHTVATINTKVIY